MYKLDLKRILQAIDKKDRNFYDSLTEDEQKGFPTPVTLRYAASVSSNQEMEHYYLATANYYCNRDFYSISKHPKLQWLLLTTLSPDFGVQRHPWISMKKKSASPSNQRKIKLMELFPTAKEEDIEILSELVGEKEIKEYCRSLGYQD